MKVNRNRHGQTLHGAASARLARAGMALALCLAAGPGHAQSAGVASLQHRQERTSAHASEAASNGQREARARAERYRAEQREAEHGRAGHGLGGAGLSPDERRKLRQNLYDLSREMYRGG